MHRNLIISGGIFHEFAASSEALAAILTESDIESEIIDDVDAGLGALRQSRYDMLTINALRWTMMTGDKYEPFRADWAYSMPRASRTALRDFVGSGGALLGMHTASICFDDWPEWGRILGGRWIWGASYHPPLGKVSACPSAARHPVTVGIDTFEVTDEIYHELEITGDVVTLMSGSCGDCDGSPPICWAHTFGEGRVVYDALGHDAASLEQLQHRKLLGQASRWLLRKA